MGPKCGVLLTLACAACAEGSGGATPVGSHFHVTVPGRLGYGWDGLDDLVGPNEPLTFEIELFRVEER